VVRVQVRFYAQARVAAGATRLDRAIASSDASVGDLLRQLKEENPSLASVLSISRVAVNGEYVDGLGFRLRTGDEVAIHPPFSGG